MSESRIPGMGFLQFATAYVLSGASHVLRGIPLASFKPSRLIIECPHPKALNVLMLVVRNKSGTRVADVVVGAPASVFVGEQAANYALAMPECAKDDVVELTVENASHAQSVLATLYGEYGRTR